MTKSPPETAGFFVPANADTRCTPRLAAIKQATKAAALGLGAARISFGPAPYLTAMDDLTKHIKALPAHTMN